MKKRNEIGSNWTPTDVKCLYIRRNAAGEFVYGARVQRKHANGIEPLNTTEKAVACQKLYRTIDRAAAKKSAKGMPTVRQFWEEVREEIEIGGQRRKTKSGYLENVNQILTGYEGTGKGACPANLLSLPMDKFDAACCRKWWNASFLMPFLLSSSKSQWVVWRKFFALAVERDLISVIPDWHIPTRSATGAENEAKLKKGKDTRLVIPDSDQFIQLVEDVRNAGSAYSEDSANWISFVGTTGLRKGEAAWVRWRDVDFDRKTLRLPGRLKGNAKMVPVIHLNTFALSSLLRLRARGYTRVQRVGEDGTPLVDKDGDPICIREFRSTDKLRDDDFVLALREPRHALQNACQRLGLGAYSPHTLRHFYATQSRRSGVDWAAIGHDLGHKDGGVLAADTYSHLTDADLSSNAAKWTLHTNGN